MDIGLHPWSSTFKDFLNQSEGSLLVHTEATEGLNFVVPGRRWDVKTAHGHPQLRNLLQLSEDGHWLYFLDPKGENQNDDVPTFLFNQKSCISRLNLVSGGVHKISDLQVQMVHSFSVKYGFIAVCSYDSVILYHEASKKIIFHEKGTEFSQPNNLLLFSMNGKLLLFLCCNHGKGNPLYEILAKPDGTYEMVLHHIVACESSLNFAVFGDGKYSKYMLACPDNSTTPCIFSIHFDGDMITMQQIEKEVPLNFEPRVAEALPNKYDSMMGAWGSGVGICAMGLEQGSGIVFDFEKSNLVAVYHSEKTDEKGERISAHSVEGQFRIATISPRDPVLIFAENVNKIHVIDMLTWNQQIINAPIQNEQIGRPPAFRGFNFALDRIVNEINQRREGGPPDQPLIGLIESDSTDDEMDLPPWFQAGGPGAPAGGPPPQIVNPMDFLGQLFGAPPGHFNFQGIEGDPLQNNPVEGDENADEDPEIGGNQIFRTLLDNLFLRQSSDINGIAWLQHRSLFYVAYGHCIQEYKVQIGAPTLKEICSEFVLKSKEKWGEWGWSKDLVEDVFATCNV